MIRQSPRLNKRNLDIAGDDSRPVGGPVEHLSDAVMEAYESGALTPHDQRVADTHLEECTLCCSRFDHYLSLCEVWEGLSGEQRLEAFRKRIESTLAPELGRSRHSQLTIDFSGDLAGTELHTSDKPSLVRLPSTLRQRREEREQQVRSVLVAAGAIERDYDYALPNGFHTDTHINLAKICRSEQWLSRLVSAVDDALRGVNFDAVVSAGWAIATVGRRLIAKNKERRRRRIRHLMVEGYGEPILLDDPHVGTKAVVLVDVVVTGRLVSRIIEELKRQQVSVVKVIAIVDAGLSNTLSSVSVDALCSLSMNLVDPDHCQRCGVLPLVEFNPVAYRMTRKKTEPRSPSKFLADDDTAREFWGVVDVSGSYEHHHIVGRRHYLGFIDTMRLLRHPHTGPLVCERLCRLIIDRTGVPDVIVVAARRRSLLVGRLLLKTFRPLCGAERPRIVVVRRLDGDLATTAKLKGRRVLVVDAAAAHGDSLDELAVYAGRHQARSVAAAVLLSRMSEACEEALDARLTGGFVRLYSLPVRPVTVRDKTAKHCPVCCRSAELKEASVRLPPGRARDLARAVATGRKSFRRRDAEKLKARQVPLFPLVACRRGVASGIALHALHAAMGDGMAPLTLPEIGNPTIPHANRAAMIEDLPAGALSWGGHALRKDLLEYLRTGTERDVWTAAVELFTRAGSPEWVYCLKDSIPLATTGVSWMTDEFWAVAACALYRVLRRSPDMSDIVRAQLQELLETHKDTSAAMGLQTMLVSMAGVTTGH
jgi:orotate phosphoribosyltransferase